MRIIYSFLAIIILTSCASPALLAISAATGSFQVWSIKHHWHDAEEIAEDIADDVNKFDIAKSCYICAATDFSKNECKKWKPFPCGEIESSVTK